VSSSRRKIFVDCDPGVDDAIALFVLFAEREAEILGVSTVAGNLPVEVTSENARRLLTLVGAHSVPVAAGAAHPLAGRLTTAPEVHGDDGLGGAVLPEPAVPLAPIDGVRLMIERILAAEAPVTLLATGPLTNVAIALRRAPGLAERLERVVVMGGSTERGNITPAAEFNVYVDPEAARIVFRSGLPITMVGLNITERVTVGRRETEALRRTGRPVAMAAADMLEFYIRYHEETRGVDSSPIHDAVAALEALNPGLLGTRTAVVDVETRGEHTRGMTVVDFEREDGARQVDVAVNVDGDDVARRILAAVEACPSLDAP
jgi:inosine-uridine nucleoside N-ribohydrolase